MAAPKPISTLGAAILTVVRARPDERPASVGAGPGAVWRVSGSRINHIGTIATVPKETALISTAW